MSVRRESRQSEVSVEWCGSPPPSVSMGVAAAVPGLGGVDEKFGWEGVGWGT